MAHKSRKEGYIITAVPTDAQTIALARRRYAKKDNVLKHGTWVKRDKMAECFVHSTSSIKAQLGPCSPLDAAEYAWPARYNRTTQLAEVTGEPIPFSELRQRLAY